MEIVNGINYREKVVELLAAEKLPVGDLPASLENFLVTRTGNEVTGVVGIEIYGEYALLRSVAVQREHRNKGIAGQLLNAIEQSAVHKGLSEIYLLTETAADYFSKKGYVPISRNNVPAEVQQSSEFSHVCPQSAIVMKKIL